MGLLQGHSCTFFFIPGIIALWENNFHLRTVIINCVLVLCAMGGPDAWLNSILGVTRTMFLHDS